ncbi:MAG TPA: CDP-alcohol phosphatidyltransferase [Bacteroidetes bacterium]|nr:CDP-alcohol phosphatidyltransferase [Bacteroidota bacterium]
MAQISKIPLTIPNILSLYRIVTFPIILHLLFINEETIFAWMLCINLVTDVLDGMLARMLNQTSEIGARLDSIADNGTYIVAFGGIFYFKMEELSPYFYAFVFMVALFFSAIILALIKFRKFPSMHLYSWKVGGYLQGFFFFLLFSFGVPPVYFWLMWTWSVFAFSEHIVIQLLSDRLVSNAKGLYWVLQERSR